MDIELADSSVGPTTAAHHPSNGHRPPHNQVVPLNDVPSPASDPGPNAPPKAQQQRAAFHTQPSTVTMRRQQAICVRRAQKQYGSAKSPNVVLDGLNMTVPKGTM